ncbi:MAG: alkaline shock response membrane anchor protein AmaP [Chloroflexota bacterium]
MNILNRIVAVVLWLILLGFAVGTVAIASDVMAVSVVTRVFGFPPVAAALSDLAHLTPSLVQVITVVVAVVVGIIMLILLKLELTPHFGPTTMILSQGQNGHVTIGYATLQKVAEKAAMGVDNVNAASCQVGSDNDLLHADCDVTAFHYADATAVGKQVEDSVRKQLEQTLGAPVKQVKVKVGLAPAGQPARLQ